MSVPLSESEPLSWHVLRLSNYVSDCSSQHSFLRYYLSAPLSPIDQNLFIERHLSPQWQRITEDSKRWAWSVKWGLKNPGNSGSQRAARLLQDPAPSDSDSDGSGSGRSSTTPENHPLLKTFLVFLVLGRGYRLEGFLKVFIFLVF